MRTALCGPLRRLSQHELPQHVPAADERMRRRAEAFAAGRPTGTLRHLARARDDPHVRQALTILAVSDVQRAARFYEAVFGWRRHVDVPVYVEFEVPGGAGVGVYLRAGFARNTGRPSTVPATGETSATELYFRVRDVDAVVGLALAEGATLLGQATVREWGDVVAYVADPDGNVLAFARPAAGD